MALLHIYDSSDSEIVETARQRVSDYRLPISNVNELKGALDGLINVGKVFDRILFETHGKPGKILFNHQPIDTQYWQLIPGRYKPLVAPYTRIYFNGCNVAEYGTGWKFLEAVVGVFLTNGDGEVFGQTTVGYALPFITSHVFHFFGSTKTLYVKGGKITERFEQ
jgi:hypothetical protein